ncbi:LOW QUALITY PROTEIN: dapper homolog 1, partial [Scomber scombrus]|uniref:LOW QUALITY PROTEIN: dapper homolog 1 n=1 Tax=Scomber scombrus TaxID=13677 RepID=UPI002DD7A79B
NCLRRRDAGLISQLQELDRQISDLRLDNEASHDQLETDSRPSSGFYELSDAASGSLSNSSNSVFSECFCCSADLTDASHSAVLECDGLVGGLCDDSSSSWYRPGARVSAPHPPALDPVSSVASCDSQSKYHCDLVARGGGDMFRYPSPLHAVAVQSSIFLQMLASGGHGRDEGTLKSREAGGETLKPEPSPLPPLVPQSSSWPLPSSSFQTPSHKRLDSYIYSLLQRRTQPIRTSRPRTSISTDPSKSILRQASLCVRQVSGPSYCSGLGTLRGSELKPCWAVEGAATSSPQRHCSVESKGEEQEADNGFHGGGGDKAQNGLKFNSSDQTGSPLNNSIQTLCSATNKDTNSLLKRKSKGLLPPAGVSAATLPKDFRELGSPKTTSCPKETDPHLKPPQSDATKNYSKPLQTVQTETGDRSVLELASVGSSSQSQEEEGGGGGGSHLVNAKYVPSQRQNVKVCKGGSKNVKVVKVKSRASEHNEPTSERRGDKSHHRSASKKSRVLEDGGSAHIKVYKRAAGGASGTSSSRIKRLPASIPEGKVLDKHNTSTLSSVRSGVSRHHHHGNHHNNGSSQHHHGQSHHHGRDHVVVVAKPKYKRNDYRRLRAIMEVPYDEAFRRAQRRQRKELLNQSAAAGFLPSTEQLSSPYSYVAGSDSEYSAECASLFHSTIADTSEDDRSNYTTNCFGDSESSEEEYVEESTTTSDTEESGGGGAGGGAGGKGRGRSQVGAAGTRAAGQEMTPAQAKAFVKIKASHNLKKKILRFRSGSLKLMTTV